MCGERGVVPLIPGIGLSVAGAYRYALREPVGASGVGARARIRGRRGRIRTSASREREIDSPGFAAAAG